MSVGWLVIVMVCAALAGGAQGAGWWSSLEKAGVALMGFDAGDKCGYTRTDALHCIAVYVDTNHDKEISASEFEHAKEAYLPKQAKMAAWIARKMGYDVTIKDVLWGCDMNKDGRLTLSDWEQGADSCLPGKADLCKLKTVCDIAAKLKQ